MGRGFHLWENYVDVSAVIMGLLDLAVLPQLTHSSEERVSKKVRAAKFMAEIARRALNLMVLIRPVTVVTAIAKEVSLYLGTQHGTSFPHSSLPPIQVRCSFFHHTQILCSYIYIFKFIHSCTKASSIHPFTIHQACDQILFKNIFFELKMYLNTAKYTNTIIFHFKFVIHIAYPFIHLSIYSLVLK